MKNKPTPQPPIIQKPDWFIGIDPGSNIGMAVWHRKGDGQKFVHIKTYKNLFEATAVVFEYVKRAKLDAQAQGRTDNNLMLIFEDARRRFITPDLKANIGRLQGAGHVKANSKAWQMFCEANEIMFKAVAPNGKLNKMADRKGKQKEAAAWFRLQTNYKGQTDQHNRVAAMLVWGS